MSDPYVGEIRAVGFDFAPPGWAMCNGQLMPISQNTALFSLLGTFYGGDGKTTFALPDLRDAAPMHWGTGSGLTPVDVGDQGGAASVILQESEMPAHTHTFAVATGSGELSSPAGGTYASARSGRASDRQYGPSDATAPMHPVALGMTGQGQPHNNMPPYLTVNFIIALQGAFPTRG